MAEELQVSTVIPVWNGEAWISRAVDSALAQEGVRGEVIVVDDGSTDGTAAILAAYGDRIRVLRQENKGLSAARNAGAQLAQGEFLAFLDADDYWLPGKLRAQVECMTALEAPGFCSVRTRLEYEDGGAAGVWECLERPPGHDAFAAILASLGGVAGSGSAVMVRRELLLGLGGFDETLESLEDVDMWLRLAAIADYRCLRQTLAVVVRRRGSMSAHRARMKRAAIRVMRKARAEAIRRGLYAHWRWCYAGMLTDYAKWEARDGIRLRALRTLCKAFCYSPVKRARLILGLAWAIAGGHYEDRGGS